MSIHPFVFERTTEAPLVLSDEAEAAFWFPLDRAATGSSRTSIPTEWARSG